LRNTETHEEIGPLVRLEPGAVVCWYHESLEKRLEGLRKIHAAGDSGCPDELRAEMARLERLVV